MVMDLFFKELDARYAAGDRDGAERFLLESLKSLSGGLDVDAQITVLNELIGFYRNTGKRERSLQCCAQALELLPVLGSEEFAGYATTLLNIATAYRAAGLNREAVALYEKAEDIYRRLLPPDDSRFAGLYNNMSLVFQALSDWDRSEACLFNALTVLERRGGRPAEIGITHSNLAALYLKTADYDKAENHLVRALAAFDAPGGESPHRNSCAAPSR